MTRTAELADFAGHPNNPMDRDQLREKFAAVTADHVGPARCEEIERTIRHLEDHDVGRLVDCP